MKHLKQWVAAALTLAMVLVFATGAAALDVTSAVGSFKVEQVYVNVPEMNVYFYAKDAQGESFTPAQVKMAGVELKLGNTVVETGSVGVAADPICYIIAIDNSDSIDKMDFYKTLAAVRTLARNKRENDQLLLYTTAGEPTCVLPATTDRTAIFKKLLTLEQQEGRMDLGNVAAKIGEDIQVDYQALAPRRVAFICTGAGELLTSLSLIGTLMTDVSSQLNLALYAFLGTKAPPALEQIATLTEGRVVPCLPEDMGKEMLARQEELATALEIRTVLPESMYGSRIETMTMSVPAMGSAIKTTTTVMMNHKQEKPQVVKASLMSRSKMVVTFNQPVSANADKPAYYSLVSEDIWGWHVKIKDVTLSEDGRTATLQIEPIYEGKYNLNLIKVASRMTPANMSDKSTNFKVKVARWPHDQAFYLARFRIPLIVAAVLLLYLLARWMRQRHLDRLAEKGAEAEHLLNDNSDAGALVMPRRYATIFFGKRGSIAESRWSGMVEGSMMLGSDAEQCDLCLADKKVAPQHCVLTVAGDALSVIPLEGRTVLVNGERIAGEHMLQNNDTLRIGKTNLELVL